MDYSDLLKSKKWKKKRRKILKRDNNECQRCGINARIKIGAFSISCYTEIIKKGNVKFFNNDDFNIGLAKIKIFGKEVICKTKLTKNDLKKDENYLILGNYIFDKNIEVPFNGSVLNRSSYNIFFKEKNKKAIKTIKKELKEKKIKKYEWKIDKEGIYFLNEKQSVDYLKTDVALNVHHKCYRKNYKPWEYKKKELVTLCNVCHKIVHDSQFIPVYDDMDRIIEYK